FLQDAVQALVLADEMQEGQQPPLLRLQPVLAAGHPLGDVQAQIAAQLAHQLTQRLFLAGKVEIKRALRDASGTRDINDAGTMEAEPAESLFRRLEDAAPGALAAHRLGPDRAHAACSPLPVDQIRIPIRFSLKTEKQAAKCQTGAFTLKTARVGARPAGPAAGPSRSRRASVPGGWPPRCGPAGFPAAA